MRGQGSVWCGVWYKSTDGLQGPVEQRGFQKGICGSLGGAHGGEGASVLKILGKWSAD